MTEIPPDLRPKAYASAELFLDILYSIRKVAKVDLDSLAIYVCVAEATMRPVLSNTDLARQIATIYAAPEEARGSITMLLAADRLGLPRETVRRKVKRLISLGLLYEDDGGRIRTTPNLNDPGMQELVSAVHRAVGRYRDRLAEFEIDI